jgi:hypothetical protein
MLSLWQNPRINELNLPVVLQGAQKIKHRQASATCEN